MDYEYRMHLLRLCRLHAAACVTVWHETHSSTIHHEHWNRYTEYPPEGAVLMLGVQGE